MTLSRAILALSLILTGLLGPQPCEAQEKPVIVKLSRNEAPPGSTLTISGRHFGDDPAKVKVTIGGQPSLISFVSATQIMLVSSIDVKPGKTQLLLTVDGRKANAMNFEVLDPEKLTKEYWRKRTELAETEQGRQQREAERRDPLKIVKFEIRPVKGARYVVHVDGEVEGLLDECVIELELHFAQKFVADAFCRIKDGRFSADFGPFRKEPFPGIYKIDLAFSLIRQRYSIRRKTLVQLGKDKVKKIRSLTNFHYITIGDPKLAKTLTEESRKHYISVNNKLFDIFDDLQNCYASSVRSIFKKGQQINEELWRTWLYRQRFIRSDEQFKLIKADMRAVKGVHLDADGWQKVVRGVLSKLRELHVVLEEHDQKFLSPRFPEAETTMRAMLAIVFDLALVRTRFLFNRNHLPIPADLRTQFGAMPFDAAPSATVGRFLYHYGRIWNTVGLTDPAAVEKYSQKPPKK